MILDEHDEHGLWRWSSIKILVFHEFHENRLTVVADDERVRKFIILKVIPTGNVVFKSNIKKMIMTYIMYKIYLHETMSRNQQTKLHFAAENYDPKSLIIPHFPTRNR